ncbi:MAG: DUF5320 domain-containing protein [Planctomycetota bacterium]
MPAGDRTGPMGQGPMTGRGAGFCAGSGVPGYANRPGLGGFLTRFNPFSLFGRGAAPAAGFGRGRGRGRGRGFGRGGGRGRRWFG